MSGVSNMRCARNSLASNACIRLRLNMIGPVAVEDVSMSCAMLIRVVAGAESGGVGVGLANYPRQNARQDVSVAPSWRVAVAVVSR